MIGFRSVCHIALGGNLPSRQGSAESTLSCSIEALAADGLVIRSVSRFFATPCFPAGAGPDYVNAVVSAATDLEPHRVLSLLHRIEAAFDRARDERWGARTLDLDLIGCGALVMPDLDMVQAWMRLDPGNRGQTAPEGLILPHPRLHERAFVLVPLCDIAPDWVHPVLNRSAAALRDALPRRDIDAVRPI